MKPLTPPRWLEIASTSLLPARDREAISGDLREAYADLAASKGPRTARLWYLRQLLSLTPRVLLFSPRFPLPLGLVCGFTAICGLWLGTMDVLLHHRDLLYHELIAGTIVSQGLLTLAALKFRSVSSLQWVVVAGCLAILSLAGIAIHGLLTTPNFEGYIFLIALALILQAILTLLNFAHRRADESPSIPSR